MATLKDVAAHAGVSIATVSCCLSGAKTVKPKTKAKIMESIEALKYIPNASARNLKITKSNRIGIILPDMNESFWAETLKGLSDCFQREHIEIGIAFSYHSPHIESSKIVDFISQNISGLIIATCQPNNAAFFTNRLETFAIPTVFIEEMPANASCNFVGFHNYQTMVHLTKALIDSKYEQLALITGPKFLSGESQCMDACSDTLKTYGLFLDPASILMTNGSKEDAFKAAMKLFHSKQNVQALLTTCASMAIGVREAAFVAGIQVPEHLKILTLGEESWDVSSKNQDIFYTKRSAYTLGEKAALLLMDNMNHPDAFHRQMISLEDKILDEAIRFPPPLPVSFSPAVKQPAPKIRILACDLSTTEALQLVSHDFTRKYGIEAEFEIERQDRMFHRIVEDCKQNTPSFDLYMVDLIWMNYLAQHHHITDITDFVKGDHFHEDAYLPQKMETCYYKDRCYGLPVIGGSQLLFYRKDLFENPAIQKQYEQQYHTPLLPPATWREFNQIAAFFTRSVRPNSPTPFGTSMAGIINEELAPELFVRLWSFGGSIWDSWNRSSLCSPESIKSMENILETLHYCEHSPFDTSITQTVEDFCLGRTAMLITYSNYANEISTRINNTFIGQTGYAPLPGNTSVNVGWNFAVNADIGDINPVYQYFYWLNEAQIQYYLTILDGQTTFSSIRQNHNLRTMYPWLCYHEVPASPLFKRTGPPKPHSLVIPQNHIEQIFSDSFRRILGEGVPVLESLQRAQEEERALLKTYGYHSVSMIRH